MRAQARIGFVFVFLGLTGCLITDSGYEPIPGSTLAALEISLSQNAYQKLRKSTYLGAEIPGRIRTAGREYDMTIEMHGNVAKRFLKKSYRIQWVDPVAGPQDFVLSAQWTDPSLCRYRLSDFLFRKAGLVCPGVRPVALYLNHIYEGAYLAIESVNDDFLNRHFGTVSSCYRLNLGGRFTLQDGMLTEQSFTKKCPDNDQSYTDLSRLMEILDRGIGDDTQTEVESALDIERVIGYCAVSAGVSNWDGMRNNLYVVMDPGSGKLQIVPWDLDNTFGGYPYAIPFYSNGLYEQIVRYEPYNVVFYEILERVFVQDELLQVLDSFQTEVAPALALDPYLRRVGADPAGTVENLRRYIDAMASTIQRALRQRQNGN